MVHCSSSDISPECSRQNPIGRISGPRSSSNTITTTSPSVLHPTSRHPSGIPTRSSYSLSDFFIRYQIIRTYIIIRFGRPLVKPAPSRIDPLPAIHIRIFRFHTFRFYHSEFRCVFGFPPQRAYRPVYGISDNRGVRLFSPAAPPPFLKMMHDADSLNLVRLVVLKTAHFPAMPYIPGNDT